METFITTGRFSTVNQVSEVLGPDAPGANDTDAAIGINLSRNFTGTIALQSATDPLGSWSTVASYTAGGHYTAALTAATYYRLFVSSVITGEAIYDIFVKGVTARLRYQSDALARANDAAMGTPAGIAATGFSQPVVPPFGFAWNFNAYPVSVLRGGIVNFNHRATIPATVWNAPLATAVFHVDQTNGNNANTGIGTTWGDFTNAVKDINRAITLGNATAAPYMVIAKPGVYPRAGGIHGVAGTTYPTQPWALVFWGGQGLIFSGDLQTWTDDGTGTNTYVTARASVSRAIPRDYDQTRTLRDGRRISYRQNYTRLADQAAVNAYSGPLNVYAQVSGNLYCKLASRGVVSNANTLLCLSSPVCQMNATTSHCFFKNADFVGGTTNGLDATYVATRNIVAEGCTWSYPNTDAATTGNAVAIDNQTGIAALINCGAYGAPADAFNEHQTAGDVSIFRNGCWSLFTGAASTTSSNGITGHEKTRTIDANGDYGLNRGGTARYIDQSQLWAININPHDDQGDGSVRDSVRTDGNAVIWLDDSVISAPSSDGFALRTSVNAYIFRRDCVVSGATSGNIAAFT